MRGHALLLGVILNIDMQNSENQLLTCLKLYNFFRTTQLNPITPCAKHTCLRGIQVCSNDWGHPSLRGDKSRRVIHKL